MAKTVTATVHPSAILRSLEADERRIAYESFVADLKAVRWESLRTKSNAK